MKRKVSKEHGFVVTVPMPAKHIDMHLQFREVQKRMQKRYGLTDDQLLDLAYSEDLRWDTQVASLYIEATQKFKDDAFLAHSQFQEAYRQLMRQELEVAAAIDNVELHFKFDPQSYAAMHEVMQQDVQVIVSKLGISDDDLRELQHRSREQHLLRMQYKGVSDLVDRDSVTNELKWQ